MQINAMGRIILTGVITRFLLTKTPINNSSRMDIKKIINEDAKLSLFIKSFPTERPDSFDEILTLKPSFEPCITRSPKSIFPLV